LLEFGQSNYYPIPPSIIIIRYRYPDAKVEKASIGSAGKVNDIMIYQYYEPIPE